MRDGQCGTGTGQVVQGREELFRWGAYRAAGFATLAILSRAWSVHAEAR